MRWFVQSVGERPLRLGELFGVVAERLHRALERGPLQHLRALLQLFAHPLLLLGQLLQRLLRFGAAQAIGALVQLLELLLHLRRHRFAQHALDVLHAVRQRRVERVRVLEPVLELLRVLPQGVDLRAELLLIARHLLGLLGLLERHRLLRIALVASGGVRVAALELTIARGVARILRQSLFLLGQALGLRRQGVGEVAGERTLLRQTRHAQHDLAAHGLLPPWRIVGRHCGHVQLVSRFERASIECEIDATLEQRRRGIRDLDALAHDRTGARSRLTPHLQLHAAHAVIVGGIDIHGDDAGRRNRRVGFRRDDRDFRCLIGDHREWQRVGQLGWKHHAVGARGGRRDPAPGALPIDGNGRVRRYAVAARVPGVEANGIGAVGQRRIARAATCRDVHAHARAARHADGRHRLERFIGATEVRRIAGPQRHIPEPAAVFHHQQGPQVGRASIGHLNGRRRADGTQRKRGAAVGLHAERRIAQRFPFRATRYRDRTTAFGQHGESHRHATRHRRRQFVEGKRRQERAAPGPDRMHHGGEPIARHARAHGQPTGRHHRRTGGEQERLEERGAHRRRQRARRQSTRHVIGRTRRQCATPRHLERAEQRSGPQLLFTFHRAGERAYREHGGCRAIPPHADGGRDHGREHHEQHRQRTRRQQPAPIGQPEGADAERHEKDRRPGHRRRQQRAGAQGVLLAGETSSERGTRNRGARQRGSRHACVLTARRGWSPRT